MQVESIPSKKKARGNLWPEGLVTKKRGKGTNNILAYIPEPSNTVLAVLNEAPGFVR
jgi:hypothetical protein